MKNQKYSFPSDFRFGVADADLQVISEAYTLAEESSQPTMWLNFARNHNLATPEHSVDRYTRWPEDIELIAGLGVHDYRTSVSMSRMLTSNGEVNPKAVTWYRNYFSALRARGLRVHATLYHWELPQALAEKGGWRNRCVVDAFAKHCAAVVTELGDLIDEYILVNEPWCISFLSYHQGIHAPGERSLEGALEAVHNVLLAIGAGFETVLSLNSKALVSTCFNAEYAYSASTARADLEAAQLWDCYFNRWFLDPLFTGAYPSDFEELLGLKTPQFTSGDRALVHIGGKLHALCLNNYCGGLLSADAKSDLHGKKIKVAGAPENSLGWPITVPPWYRDGLYDILTQVYHSYRRHGLKRIYISENGMALRDDGSVLDGVIQDSARIAYYQAHLAQVHAAICAGVPVDAYFAWTLMDNYEWAEGYRPDSCFGLVHVDRTTLTRSPRQSYYWYRNVAQSKVLSWKEGYAYSQSE